MCQEKIEETVIRVDGMCGSERIGPIVDHRKCVDSSSERDVYYWEQEFSPPLRSAAGECRFRSGCILRESRGGDVRYGEIAPFPGFGLEDISWKSRVEEWLHSGDYRALGKRGCSGFAAWCLRQRLPLEYRANGARLIHGNSPADFLKLVSTGGKSTWKVKIGLESELVEMERIQRWIDRGGAGVKFRLDANQGLDLAATSRWLEWMEAWPMVEFLEQPLPVGEEERLVREFGDAAVRLALDESVVSSDGLEFLLGLGWPGVFVVKASLFGDPNVFLSLSREVRRRIVISSAFESGVGFGYILVIASDLVEAAYAHGLGTRGAFVSDDLDGWGQEEVYSGEVTVEGMNRIIQNAGSR